MNRDIAQGQWQQLSGKIKQKWGRLTDDDLTRAQGDRDYLVGKVHEQYGIARDRVEDELQTLGYREDDQDVDLRSSHRSAAGRMDAAGSEQGGNLDREDPAGRSNRDSRSGDAGEPPQPGGAGHTLEAGSKGTDKGMESHGRRSPGSSGH